MTNTAPQPTKQFYRRELPDGCIEFSSKEGKQIFREALSAGYLDCYFKLAAQFRTQDEPAFCGLSTLVMVLNALSVDPGRVWKGPWRWYHERMLECCTPLSEVEEQGITFDNFNCLAETNFLITKPMRAHESYSEEEFREVVKQITMQEETIMVVSYSRKVLNQTGDGHFSPIGGYHPGKDLVLVLDTARFKYPPHWVKVSAMVEAMKKIDQDTGEPRGYVLLSRHSKLSPLLLFRISPQLSVTLREGLSPELKLFVGDLLQWMYEAADSDQTEESIVREAVLELLKLAPSLSEPGSILTSQVNIKCPQTVSPGHMCSVKSIIDSVEKQNVFNTVSQVISEYTATASKEPILKVCKAAGAANGEHGNVKCCELLKILKPSHFFTALLLSWPYRMITKSTTNATVLIKLVEKSMEQSSSVLQNEIHALQQQLTTILKLYCNSYCTCIDGACRPKYR